MISSRAFHFKIRWFYYTSVPVFIRYKGYNGGEREGGRGVGDTT
jgi:hypothetical protein